MKKTLKRITSLLLVTVMVGLLLPNIKVNAAVKLNKTKATLYVGNTVTLKLSGAKNVTWSTSDKKVATVSKSGKVKGKKAGKTIITATAKGKQYTCKITVKELKEFEIYEEDFLLYGSGKALGYLGDIVDGSKYYLDGKEIEVNIVNNNGINHIYFPEPLSEGPHTFTIKKTGYKPFSMSCDFTPPVFNGIWSEIEPYEQNKILIVRLNPEIEVSSVVAQIDGKPVQPMETPEIDLNGSYVFMYDIADIELGDHTVTIEANGYERSEKVFNKFY